MDLPHPQDKELKKTDHKPPDVAATCEAAVTESETPS
jgi:hypothetical protein